MRAVLVFAHGPGFASGVMQLAWFMCNEMYARVHLMFENFCPQILSLQMSSRILFMKS